MVEAYCKLHELGIIKVLKSFGKMTKLVGVLYGVDLGHVFVGEVCFQKYQMQVNLLFIAFGKTIGISQLSFVRLPSLQRSFSKFRLCRN